MSTIKIRSKKIVPLREFSWLWKIPMFNLPYPYIARFSLDNGKLVLRVRMKHTRGPAYAKTEPTWEFEQIHSSLIDKKYHLQITVQDDQMKRVHSDTVDYIAIKLNHQEFGNSRYYVSNRNVKYCLDSKNTMNLRFMLTIRDNDNPFDASRPVKLDENIYTDALKKYVGCNQFADFEFIINDEEKFPAHKAVLASRSEFFNKIFSSNDKKQEEKIANITDVSKEAFKSFLTYLYSGKLINADKLFNDLLLLSNKFEITGMNNDIADVFTNHLNETNAHDAFQCTHRYDLGQNLKVETFKLIQKKFATINQELDESLINDPQSVKNLMDAFESLLHGLKSATKINEEAIVSNQ